MKINLLLLFLLFSLPSISQTEELKIYKIHTEKIEIDSINKIGRVKAFPFSFSIISEEDAKYFMADFDLSNHEKTLKLNYKFTKDGKFLLIKGDKGIKRPPVPEELRGIPAFDNHYYDNQEFIDKLNHFFNQKKIRFSFYTDKEKKNQLTDLGFLTDLIFYGNFTFTLKKL